MFTNNEFNGFQVRSRNHDGYICVQDLMEAAGYGHIPFAMFLMSEENVQYLTYLEMSTGLKAMGDGKGLVEESWIHPQLATRVAQWLDSHEMAEMIKEWGNAPCPTETVQLHPWKISLMQFLKQQLVGSGFSISKRNSVLILRRDNLQVTFLPLGHGKFKYIVVRHTEEGTTPMFQREWPNNLQEAIDHMFLMNNLA